MDQNRVWQVRKSLTWVSISEHNLSDEIIAKIDAITMLQKPINNEEYNQKFISNYWDQIIK